MYRVLAVAAVVVSAAGSSFTCRKGAYDGVELLSVDNVGSVEGCQDICKGIEGCASVTLAAGTCKVVGKTAVLDPTLEGTSCTLIETLDFDCADDRVFGTSVFSIGAVASLAECQQQCASFPAVCRGINYLPDGTCEIVEQTGVLADAGAKGQSCLRVGSVAANSAGADNQSAAGVLYTCIQRSAIDMATGEELLSFTAIESVEECFALCDELAVCRAFSLTGSDCVLVGKAAAGDLALLFEHKQNSAACMKADDGANTELAVLLASGAQTTAAATFECRTDLQLSGANMRIASGVSLSSCEKLCASLPECAAFTFEEQAKAAACFLKRDTVEPSLATAPSKGKACVKATYSGMFSKQPQGFATAVDSSAASAAAAGESAKDDESSAAGVRSLFACSPTGRASLTGGVRLSEVDNVATQEECFSLCLAKPACETVVFQPKRGVCALVAGEPTITRMPKGTQSSSETAICTKKQDLDFPRFRCEAGSFAGATLSSLAHIASPRECVEKCTAAPGCHVAVFHAADKRCVLKTVLATPVQATEGGVVSCVAVEVAQSKGFNCVGGAALTSGTISLLSDQSLSECRAMCGKMAECASLEYDTERRACALKDGDARVAAADAGHFVCAKTDGSSGDFHPRLVRALAASTQDYAVVKFKYGIHVDRLTAAVFSTLAAPDNTSTISTLWVRTQVRVPGGLAPKAYEATVLREIDDEMAHHHGAFLSNLNPSLATLGLATLCAGSVECRWSVVSEGVEWKTSDAPAVVLELEAPAGTRDFTSDAERIVLANSMGHLLDVAAHQVSITSIQHCVADACQLAWEAATPDGTGGATAAAAGFGESTVQKVSVVVTLASGASTAEFCGKAAASPVCSDATTPVPFPSFSCVSCEATAGDASSGAGSASLGRRVLAQSRQANTLALTGLSRSCEVGWMPADFGIASHVFDAADGNLEGKTLQQCVDACAAAPGCVAFSRIFALAADEAGACLLKTAAPSVAGDVTARLGYRTYVVSCPLVEHACAFTPAPGADARAANSSFDTARTASFKECKALCEADASCHAVSYDTVKALCHLIPADSPVDLQVHTDYTSAVCVREGTHTASPCDDGYCGITAAHSCFEYGSSGGFQCGCSPGFSCAERCDDPRQAHGCERTAAMLGLYVDAVATSLSVGVGAVEVAVEEVEKVDDDVPGVRPGVTEAPADPVVVVSRSKIDANATHVAAVTFESTNTEELFGLSGPSTKLQLFLEAVANDLGLPPAAVTAKTLCQHAPDGSVVACVDADGAATELHLEPLIRVTPVRNHQNGVDWCASVDPVVLATTKTQDDIDSLVQAAGGLLMDTRRYWVSAVCDDGCDAGANWGWADGAAVDWAAIGLSELAADAKCAVLEWSAEEFRWGLAAVACDRADAYPVCVYLSAPDAEALCAATSDCALKVTVAVVLPHVHTVSFVTLPGGATKMYHPTVALPPNAKMVAQDGSSLGYTDANGRTTAIRYPAVDQTTNAVVLSVLPGYTYISEALSALLRMHIAAWLSQASVTTKLSELCHQSVSMQQIKCTDGLCSASNPPLITRTSCEGSPPCSNNDCNGNGYVRGFAGHCQCTCLQGFTGTDCGSCATGYVHYPTCEWNEANGAEPQYIFAHLLLSTSPSSVGAQLSLLGDNLDTAIGYMSDQTFIAYVCPTSVCATKSCDSAIMSWDPSRRAMCDTTDDNATDVSTARSVALLEADETLVEVQVQFNAFFSRKAAAAAQEFQQTMQDYRMLFFEPRNSSH
ncbi:hypothetical protein DIPPA_05690 [Diplonema papillatum]|nr:hypothetical protein DIPPA_05690 [Diplonema papillatum]